MPKSVDDGDFSIRWLDHFREPQCAPDPAYPDGIDIDVSKGRKPACTVQLPHPAKRCGVYIVTCHRCHQHNAVTTAGRPDDPRSLTMGCKLS